jgi:hypothetical protein
MQIPLILQPPQRSKHLHADEPLGSNYRDRPVRLVLIRRMQIPLILQPPQRSKHLHADEPLGNSFIEKQFLLLWMAMVHLLLQRKYRRWHEAVLFAK